MPNITGYPPATLPYGATDTVLGTQGNATSLFLVSGVAIYPGAHVQAAAAGNLTPPANLTAFFMQGMAAAFTPTRSGNVAVTFSGTVVSPAGTTAGLGMKFQASYGTGSAPANGGNLAGTQLGPIMQYTNASTVTAADVHVPFSHTVAIANLTLNTAYWVDEAAESVGTISDMGFGVVGITVIEQ